MEAVVEALGGLKEAVLLARIFITKLAINSANLCVVSTLACKQYERQKMFLFLAGPTEGRIENESILAYPFSAC